jgi:hypothetical protein
MRTIACNRLLAALAIGGILMSTAFPGEAAAQTTSVKAEYLMTLYGTLKQQTVDAGLRVIEVSSGWVEGPKGSCSRRPEIGTEICRPAWAE